MERDVDFEKIIPLIKFDEEERLVYGVVLEPETVDSQGDIVSEIEIRKACWKFMEQYQQSDVEHSLEVNPQIAVRECFVAPSDFEMNGQMVRKGSWVLGVGVYDDKVWSRVKKGELNGFSVYGRAVDEPI